MLSRTRMVCLGFFARSMLTFSLLLLVIPLLKPLCSLMFLLGCLLLKVYLVRVLSVRGSALPPFRVWLVAGPLAVMAFPWNSIFVSGLFLALIWFLFLTLLLPLDSCLALRVVVLSLSLLRRAIVLTLVIGGQSPC